MKSFFFSPSVLKLSLLWLIPVIVATAVLQLLDFHLIQEVTSLHGSIVSGAFFILGFILSATIADYKEGERLPAEFAATVTNMFHDISNIGRTYPQFDTTRSEQLLLTILRSVRSDVVEHTSKTRIAIYELGSELPKMELAGVPANYIVKLKQEQSQLVRSLMRIQYIQRIHFIPSAFLLARIITVGVVVLLLVTKVEPIAASILVAGLISFIFIYVMSLLDVIRKPFHADGQTRDDVSMFLVNMAIVDLESTSQRVPALPPCEQRRQQPQASTTEPHVPLRESYGPMPT